MKQNTPQPPALHGAWTCDQIKAQMDSKGLTLASIAENHGLTPQSIGQAVRGVRQGRLARLAVAQSLGIQVTDIWPNALLPLRVRRLRSAS